MWTAIRFTVVTFVLAGLIYPLSMVALGQLFFPNQANGSLIQNSKGQWLGSFLIGQSFSRPEYFHPRPSANGYDASNSGGSNLGATSQKLMDRIKKDLTTYQQEDVTASKIPVDAVTASGSGLDPHITLANALLQAPRVAKARKLPLNQVNQLIQQHAEHSPLGASSYLNVLRVNLALDRQQSLKNSW